MSERAVFVLRAAVAIVLFDAGASLASTVLGVPYGLLGVGSFVIYFVVGLLAARNYDFTTALGSAAFVGLTDATLGWAVSWALGPSRPTGTTVEVAALLATAAMVVLMATVVGALGGGLGRWIVRLRLAANESDT